MKKNTFGNVERLDFDDIEDNCFSEGNINTGKPIASFSFGVKEDQATHKQPPEQSPPLNKPSDAMGSIMTFGSSQRGLTPAVNGELFTIKRCYQFRPSTIRKLNEIKAKHPDINVYLNTLIDEAISYYYDCIMNEKSTR